MNNKNYNVAKIEKFLGDYFLSNNIATASQIYLGSRPSVDITKDLDFFIVISVPSNVIDRNSFGQFIARVDIYARSNKGRKNTVVLTSIHDKIFDLLPIITEDYSFDLLSELGDFDSLGYHVAMINLTAIAKIRN